MGRNRISLHSEISKMIPLCLYNGAIGMVTPAVTSVYSFPLINPEAVSSEIISHEYYTNVLFDMSFDYRSFWERRDENEDYFTPRVSLWTEPYRYLELLNKATFERAHSIKKDKDLFAFTTKIINSIDYYFPGIVKEYKPTRPNYYNIWFKTTTKAFIYSPRYPMFSENFREAFKSSGISKQYSRIILALVLCFGATLMEVSEDHLIEIIKPNHVNMKKLINLISHSLSQKVWTMKS